MLLRRCLNNLRNINNRFLRLLFPNKKRYQVRLHPLAVSNGKGMKRHVNLIRNLSVIKPENVFEIGANFAQDSEYLRIHFDLKPDDVYVFEPHPQIVKEIKKVFNFNVFDVAVSDQNGKIKFYAVHLKRYNNSGVSSMYRHKDLDDKYFDLIDTQSIRMDSFIKEHNVEAIDFLKIDVEGATFDVLKGFGDEITRIKSLHIETEHDEVWKGQKLFDDIYSFLNINGFQMAYFELLDGKQSDSFWIQKRYLKAYQQVTV
jgi:FkbM family methyltransferase